jgi:N-acetylneuraminic acid mutarotase
MPGSRNSAVSWTDSAGHLWMFGGEGLDSAGTYDFLNDLWEFDPSKSAWTWMGGASAVPSCGLQYCAEPGVYGTLGSPSPANIPGNRINASGWTDGSGNFWLFGGTGLVANSSSIYLNDLWKFDPMSGQWAWMSGSSTAPPAGSGGLPGVYGTLGVPATANYPGSRSYSTSWTDASGHLWLFGGAGYDSVGTFGSLNDLWEFLPATSQWVWMSGNSTIPCNAAQVCGQPGVYGTLGTPSPANLPGGRDAALGWTDASGNLWLFGGQGLTFGNLNDLWKFDQTSTEWTWMGGSNTEGVAGVYGTLGTPTAANVPGSREQAVSWTDSNGNFWLFGGGGNDASDASGYLNDLWMYSPSLGQWTWVSGGNAVGQLGVYGTLGAPVAANVPGSRRLSVS